MSKPQAAQAREGRGQEAGVGLHALASVGRRCTVAPAVSGTCHAPLPVLPPPSPPPCPTPTRPCPQVYAASIMFGYFLRRVDRRFRLARSAGMLPDSREDAVTRLERLFAMVREGPPAEGRPAEGRVAAAIHYAERLVA